MTIPEEVSSPIKTFFLRNGIVIVLTIILLFMAYVSIWILCPRNKVEKEIDKVIEFETGYRLHLACSRMDSV